MNFRITTLMFGLLLGVLWIFGLMMALGRSTYDLGLVFPRFSKVNEDKINFIDISKKDGKRFIFMKTADGWRLKIPPNEQLVRVEKEQVRSFINELRDARHSNDETDVNRNLNDERWGLNPPKMTITLKGEEGGPWQLFIGNDREDGAYTYVKSSDRERDVLAVKRSALLTVLFTDIDTFRVRKLLEAKDAAAVRLIDLKETRDGKTTELLLDKTKGKPWWIKKPALGPADFEGGPGNLPETKPETKVENIQSVRGLVSAALNLKAADFEALDSPVTVEEKNALLRIEIATEKDAPEPGEVKKDDKEPDLKKEVLLIGDKVKDKDQYFARLLSDNSVVRVSSEKVDAILAVIKDPKLLRSHDVSQIDPAAVDAVEIWLSKEWVKLFKGDQSGWRVFPYNDSPHPANAAAITESTGLLAAIQGKNEVKDKDFEDLSKIKEVEAKFAPDKLEAKITVWANSLLPEPEKKDKVEDKKTDKVEDKKADKVDDKKAETDPKSEVKKTDAKDSKADDQKAGGKDKTDAKDKKAGGKDKTDGKKDDQKVTDKDAAKKTDQTKAENAEPKFKDGVKSVVTLSFVKVDKEKVLVKREAPDAEPIYFQLAVAAFDKMVPRDLALAFFDNNLKTFSPFNVTKFELQRAPGKDREKMVETFVLERESKDKAKDAKADDKKADDKKGDDKKAEEKKADDKKAEEKKADDKKVGDKDAQPKSEWKLLEPKEFAGKGEVETGQVNSVLFRLSQLQAVRWVKKIGKDTLAEYGLDDKHWTIRVNVTVKKQEGDKEEPKPFVLRLGDASNKDTDKGAVFASLEGTDYVFLVDSQVEKLLKDAEFRDRHVLKFDVAKVKELRVFITQDKETRKPVFEREVDKTWKDKTGNLGFKIDSRRVDDLLDKLSDLQVVRYLNVKGNGPKDFELGEAAPLRFEVVMDDGKTVHTLAVGAASEKSGPFYAQSNALPGGVFLVGKDPFAELMGKVSYFRKD